MSLPLGIRERLDLANLLEVGEAAEVSEVTVECALMLVLGRASLYVTDR